MKKVILSTAFVILASYSWAQVDTIRSKEHAKNVAPIVTDRAPKAVYLLLGGSGPEFSVNYDSRFLKRANGPGFAIGLGYMHISSSLISPAVSIFSIPASVNYLVGRKSHFLEIAGGATYITGTVTDFLGASSSGSGFFYHLSAGYRYQPAEGGFFFRGGISPLFIGGFNIVWYYLGFGHNF